MENVTTGKVYSIYSKLILIALNWEALTKTRIQIFLKNNLTFFWSFQTICYVWFARRDDASQRVNISNSRRFYSNGNLAFSTVGDFKCIEASICKSRLLPIQIQLVPCENLFFSQEIFVITAEVVVQLRWKTQKWTLSCVTHHCIVEFYIIWVLGRRNP